MSTAQPTAEDDIVVALLGDEATVKHLYRHADCTLRPANAALEPIFVDDVQITAVWRVGSALWRVSP